MNKRNWTVMFDSVQRAHTMSDRREAECYWRAVQGWNAQHGLGFGGWVAKLVDGEWVRVEVKS